MSGCPYICMPPCMFICPHTFVHPRVYTPPPYSPILFCASVCFWEALHVCGGVVMGSPLCWDTSLTPPLFGGASPSNTPPTLSHWFPVHQCVSGISVCYVGISLLLKGLGMFPHQLGGFGASALKMSICSFLYIFCSALCVTF